MIVNNRFRTSNSVYTHQLTAPALRQQFTSVDNTGIETTVYSVDNTGIETTVYISWQHRHWDNSLLRWQQLGSDAKVKEAVLIFAHILYLKPEYLPGGGASDERSECGNRVSDANFLIVTMGLSCFVFEIWPWGGWTDIGSCQISGS